MNSPQNNAGSSLRRLFFPTDDFLRRGLKLLPEILDEVMPLTRSQANDLPRAVRDLSALLTTERHQLSRPYWASPRLTSAYLRYFLPWNLVRLGALFPGLPLLPPEGEVTWLDLGSGPLTLPLALWLSRPDLRRLPLRVIASDNSPHAQNLGLDIFHRLRQRLDPDSPWMVKTLRAPLAAAPRLAGTQPWLISMGNVLNEWEQSGRQGDSSSERLSSLLEGLSRSLAKPGLILVVEPGTRLGGKLISRLREVALEGQEYHPLSPCPHEGNCPMLRPGAKAWCHFNAGNGSAPESLHQLSRRAGLDKDSVSLSFLLLSNKEEPAPQSAPGLLAARIVSEAFVLPGHKGRARYACTGKGLALIPDSASLPGGSLIGVEPGQGRDAKSGALIMNTPRSHEKGEAAPSPGKGPARFERSARPERPSRSEHPSRPAPSGPKRARTEKSGRQDERPYPPKKGPSPRKHKA